MQVLDRTRLATVAKWVANRRPDAIPQATMWRMTHQKSSAISLGTLTALQAVLLEEAAQRLFWDLEIALMSPGGAARRTAHRQWMIAQLRRFFFRAAGRDGWRYDATDAVDWIVENEHAVAQSFAELELSDLGAGDLAGHALLRWGSLCALVARIERGEAGTKLKAFRESVDDVRDLQGLERYLVALINILGPLLESPENAFVERQWEELADDELSAFVIHGIERERILLKRPALTSRIQELQRAASDVPESDQLSRSPAPTRRSRVFGDQVVADQLNRLG